MDLTIRHDFLVNLSDLADNQIHFLRHLLEVGVGGFHVYDGYKSRKQSKR